MLKKGKHFGIFEIISTFKRLFLYCETHALAQVQSKKMFLGHFGCHEIYFYYKFCDEAPRYDDGLTGDSMSFR